MNWSVPMLGYGSSVLGWMMQHGGGDVDLLVDSERSVDHPALLAASLSARISRCLQGRKVDVLIAAPNLAVLPIHTVAREEGQAL
jgi:predicted nucleotidyltransferase